MKVLDARFLSQYPNKPDHMNELGSFVFYRTYSRWLEAQGRRETWQEAVARAVDYNVGIAIEQYEKNNIVPPLDEIAAEAQELFHSIFNLRQFLSGRTHWVGGADTRVADKFPLANFNCSFLNIRSWEDLTDLFYLLLVGTGVGFKCTKEMAAGLAPIRTNFTLIHSEYVPLPKNKRLEHTTYNVMDNGFAKIYVGDSKEGWVDSLAIFLQLLTDPKYENIHTIKISYNSIRPKGEKLRTFGGTASGHLSLLEMFENFEKVLKNQMDPHLDPLELSHVGEPDPVTGYQPEYRKVRPIHILDMGNLVGANVVVGGVRRTAEIFLFDADDVECMLAKYGINGIWDEAHHKQVMVQLKNVLGYVPMVVNDLKLFDADARPLHHRRMSNNSIAFTSKPSRDMLHLVFTIMQKEGEPGFINLESAARRVFKGMGITSPTHEMLEYMMVLVGLNPCAEILLMSYGVCNLTTVNVKAFVHQDARDEYVLDLDGLLRAQRLSVRAGLRMTCLTLELPHWDKVQKQNRLVGPSLTGWKDAISLLGMDKTAEEELLWVLADVARQEAVKYANELRIPVPVLVTTIKPEGTLSQVAGGVSSGLHMSHAPYYIRRIRINAHDPLAKVALELGWTVNPEVGTPGETHEERMENARTLVIDFPVASGAQKTKDDVGVEEQFETYFMFQEHYTEHNSSNTIHVREHEWAIAEEIIYENWDRFTAVSFLSYDGNTYQLAPYEAISEEQYHKLKASMSPFDETLLLKYEASETEKDTENMDSCEGGACPIF